MVIPSFRVVIHPPVSQHVPADIKAYRCLAETAAGKTCVYCFYAIIIKKTEISLKK